MPANIYVSASVDGKRYPMRLRYFPKPDITASENGQPCFGWLYLKNVLQTGKFIKIEFEMQDRGDILLMDEIQVWGLKKILVFFREDMDFWAFWDPDTEVETLDAEDLVKDGNLILNPTFHTDDKGMPLGVRLEAPQGTLAKIVRNGDSDELLLKRESGTGDVNLVLGTVARESGNQDSINAQFSAQVKVMKGASCVLAVEDPGGKAAVGSVKIAPGDWQEVKIPVTLAGQSLPRIRLILSGEDQPALQLRNVRLAVAPAGS